jgi:hypothetical protein
MHRADPPATDRAPGDRRPGLVVFGILELVIGLALAALAPLSVLAAFLASSVDLAVVVPSVALYCVMGCAFVALGVGTIRARRWACALSLSVAWIWLLTGICTVVATWSVAPRLWRDLALDFGLSAAAAGWLSLGINGFLVLVYLVVPTVFVLFFRSPRTIETCRRRDPSAGWPGEIPQRLLALAVAYAVGGLSVLAMPAYGFVFPVFGVVLSGWPGGLLWTGVAALAAVLTWGTIQRRIWAWRLAMAASVLAGVSCAITFAVVAPEDLVSAMRLPPEHQLLFDLLWPSSPSIQAIGWLLVWGSLTGYLVAVKGRFGSRDG